MNEENAILTRILARTDALLLPEPGECGALANIRWQHAETWRRSGLPYRGEHFTPGLTTKDAGKTLSALETAGLIVCAGGKARRTHVKLTYKGHERARDLIDWPCGGYGAWGILKALQAVPERAGYCDLAAWWVADPLLEKRREEILWALGAGWAIADTDSHGRRFVSVTPAGLAVTKRPANGVTCGEDAALQGLYAEALAEALADVRELPLLSPRDTRVLFLQTYTDRRAAR
jgi:hypothetical protein